MTQQLDLTFNTANTMDKMMTQSQSKSYSSSSYANADKFDNFLNNANKSYTQESNKNFNDNKTQTKTDYKNESNKSNVTDSKTDYKESTKYDESSNTVTEEKTSQTEENSKETKANTKTDVAEETSNVIVPETVVDNNEVDVKEMMLVSNVQMANLDVSKEEVSNQGKTLTVADAVVDEEIPAEAIKSGINLETLANAVETTVEDTTGVDMQAVENAVKDTVSKEDTIAALYKVGADKVEEVKDVNVDTEKLTNVDIKVDTNVDTKVEANVTETNVKDDTKIVLNDDVKVADKISDDVKNVDDKQIVDIKNDVITDDLKVDVKDVDNKADKKEETNNLAINLQDVKENVENKVNVINVNEVVDNKTQKVETKADVKTTPDKMTELKEEVQSAKAENAYETLSSQNEKSVKNDNKIDDKFAKTNVQAEETIKIKDDTKGIEFVSQKQDKVVDKNDVQDKHLANAKEKFENVKIQVEDNVKVNVNNQVQDSAKVEKANETMNKAGLSTQTLREMNGKVTAMETGNQTGAQFGETSQEMLMRDMLSQNATTQTTDAKTTVDFAQTMNKTTVTQQPQAQQNTQEAQEVNILDQIRAKFAVSKQNGLQKITIGLTPESLGKVTVEIVKGQNGISAHLLADNPQAKEILDKNLDGLKSVLQSQGVNVNNVNVKVAEAGRSSDSNNNMFQNEDGQFNQGSNGEHSRGDNSSNQERRSEYEFMQNNAMQADNSEVEETTNTVQMEKTISIKGGNGKISYKL
ncbi:MAG: hypothetical protein DKM23_03840 [Candidatus Melainabacteria bacterium]|nr:MAG: hypothetical protein DKM23_03840 [Candidatus Melainabacteria bacterium]